MSQNKNMRTITIKDVASAASVSLATASRVLSGRGYASDASKNKVLKAAKDLGYKPNDLARNLKLQRTDTVGLMITDIVNPFYSYLADGVIDCARKLGYHVVLCATDEDASMEKEYLSVLMKQRAAGIIAVPTGHNVKIWGEAHKMGVKLVLVDRELQGVPDADVVMVDNPKGAFEAVEYLIQLGHKRIGIINGPITTTTGKGRLEGYQQAMQAAGLPMIEELIKIVTFKGESGVEATRTLLSLSEPPTAIFAANNVLGEAAYHVVLEHGLSIPEDISLILFDDVPWASLVRPAVTVVAQPTYNLGYLGMELVHRKLAADEQGIADIPKKSILSPELIIRGSCTSPKITK